MTILPPPDPSPAFAASTAILKSLRSSSTIGTVSFVQAICNAGGFCRAFTIDADR